MRLAALSAAVCALAGAAAGCGLGPGEPRAGAAGASVLVTQEFGDRRLGQARADTVPAGETVMRMLQRSFDVETRYGGGFVQSVNGVAGGRGELGREDWFFYVNGIEAGEGAAATRVTPGDRVQWDFHAWEAAQRIPAIVGAYPEPFRSGLGGDRFPVRIDCAPASEAACDAVAERLLSAGVTTSRAVVGAPVGTETLRLLVGPWRTLRRDSIAALLEEGPSVSGVFARPAADGRSIALLDPAGDVAGTVAAGAGLVAATGAAELRPTWVVTGVDAAGVTAAAQLLSEPALSGRFAVAAVDGAPVGLPAER